MTTDQIIITHTDDAITPFAYDTLTHTDDAITPFAYDTLDSETRIVVQQKTGEIRERIDSIRRSSIEVGQRLREVKQRLRHGQWGEWLEREFRWSDQTALNMINVAEMADQTPKMLEFEDRFAKSALTALAAPSTPPEARQAAMQLAESGEKVTNAKAQQLIAAHKPEPTGTFGPHLPPDFNQAQARAKKLNLYISMNAGGKFTMIYESTRAVADTNMTWEGTLGLLTTLERDAATPRPAQTALPGVADDQEIAAAPGPTPALALTPIPPPMLTPLPPVALATSDDQALIQASAMLLYVRKLLVFAHRAVDDLVRPYLEQNRMPIVTLDEAQAEAAARLALVSPAMRAQAGMLTFGAALSWDVGEGQEAAEDEEIIA